MELLKYSRNCRICLKSSYDISKNIFSYVMEGYEEPLVKILFSLFQIELHEHEAFPQLICRKCVSEMENILLFKEDVARNQEMLLSLFTADSSYTEENDLDVNDKIKSEALPVSESFTPHTLDTGDIWANNCLTCEERERTDTINITRGTTIKTEVKTPERPNIARSTNISHNTLGEPVIPQDSSLQNLNLITLQDAELMKTKQESSNKKHKVFPVIHKKPRIPKNKSKGISESVSRKVIRREKSNDLPPLFYSRSFNFLSRYGSPNLNDLKAAAHKEHADIFQGTENKLQFEKTIKSEVIDNSNSSSRKSSPGKKQQSECQNKAKGEEESARDVSQRAENFTRYRKPEASLPVTSIKYEDFSSESEEYMLPLVVKEDSPDNSPSTSVDSKTSNRGLISIDVSRSTTPRATSKMQVNKRKQTEKTIKSEVIDNSSSSSRKSSPGKKQQSECQNKAKGEEESALDVSQRAENFTRYRKPEASLPVTSTKYEDFSSESEEYMSPLVVKEDSPDNSPSTSVDSKTSNRGLKSIDVSPSTTPRATPKMQVNKSSEKQDTSDLVFQSDIFIRKKREKIRSFVDVSCNKILSSPSRASLVNQFASSISSKSFYQFDSSPNKPTVEKKSPVRHIALENSKPKNLASDSSKRNRELKKTKSDSFISPMIQDKSIQILNPEQRENIGSRLATTIKSEDMSVDSNYSDNHLSRRKSYLPRKRKRTKEVRFAKIFADPKQSKLLSPSKKITEQDVGNNSRSNEASKFLENFGILNLKERKYRQKLFSGAEQAECLNNSVNTEGLVGREALIVTNNKNISPRRIVEDSPTNRPILDTNPEMILALQDLNDRYKHEDNISLRMKLRKSLFCDSPNRLKYDTQEVNELGFDECLLLNSDNVKGQKTIKRELIDKEFDRVDNLDTKNKGVFGKICNVTRKEDEEFIFALEQTKSSAVPDCNYCNTTTGRRNICSKMSVPVGKRTYKRKHNNLSVSFESANNSPRRKRRC